MCVCVCVSVSVCVCVCVCVYEKQLCAERVDLLTEGVS